jgi:hypothetical protein
MFASIKRVVEFRRYGVTLENGDMYRLANTKIFETLVTDND